MYRISKWKLALIIGVFLFSVLYLLPTIQSIYGRFYGYLDLWMQGKIPPPSVQSDEDGEAIMFAIPKDDLPKGISVPEAVKSIQDMVGRRLNTLGVPDEEFSFDSVAATDLYIDFGQMKSETDLEAIISNLELGGDPPLVSSQPVLSMGDPQGSIKFAITKDDFPAGGGVQEALRNVKDRLREQLQAQEVSNDEFSFNEVSRNELYVRFGKQKSAAEVGLLMDDLRLYGSIPLALRPIFPDNPLKQGLDLKGGLHIVLELDVEKAMDIYLDGQAKEVVLGSLKREKIFCKSVEKTLDKVDDHTLIMRPYVAADSTVTEVQYVANIKKKLMGMGLGADDIEETSDEAPELTIKVDAGRDVGEFVDTLLGGSNALIVSITIPQRFQDQDKEDYLDTAEETLDGLELFDKPERLQVRENVAVFSVRLSKASAERLAEDNLDTVMDTLENRINKFGVAESTIRRVQGRPRILIEIPEEQNPTRTLAAIKSPGILEFKLAKPNPVSGTGVWSGGPETTEPSPDDLPQGTEVRQHVEGGWYVLDSEAFMHGADLKSNSATVRRGEFGTPEVIMYLTRDGQRKFSEFTGLHVDENTAILLDEVIQSAPRITEKISSASARITGSFTEEEADYLARILKAGAFPAPMKSAEERIVGPTLGEDAIRRGKLAFAIGISLVVVFMLIYYKGSGAIAVVALLFNFGIILGVLAGFGATLTLPGMAGLILTIGMSVDANVLIFERIREELKIGKTVRSAIDSGYQKAFWTILDANVTTFLTALVLYEFGTGPIKGFAVTLSVGIMASMFTALVVTREIYRWVYRRRSIAGLSI